MSRPRSPWLECRTFNFENMPGPGRIIGTRPASNADLDSLIQLAKTAHERIEGGPDYGVYQFCLNSNQDSTYIFQHDIENALADETKSVYLIEDTASKEILAAVIVVYPHENEDTWDTLERDHGPEYTRWIHFQNEIYQMRKDLSTNKTVQLQALFVQPQFSYITTRDPDNPEPFLAKVLFQFIYEGTRNALEITAIVPFEEETGAVKLYKKLGFEVASGEGSIKTVGPPAGTRDMASQYRVPSVTLQLMVWRRKAYSS